MRPRFDGRRWHVTWLDRLVRRLVPSLPLLTRSRVIALLLELDRVAAIPFAEFRGLPPNRFRVRVGVGNRILFNQPLFLATGSSQAARLFALDLASPDSAILDLGSGCGRLALALRDGGIYNGTYTGIDADREMVRWCQRNLAGPNFNFLHADVFNRVYNPTGKRAAYPLPVEDHSQDLLTSSSLFSHLLEAELEHYLSEGLRVLAGRGKMAMTFFCLEDMAAHGELGGRWTFPHRIGRSRVQDRRYPEAAVAYEREFLLDAAKSAGFEEAEVLPYPIQSMLVCRTQRS
jgi:SAM-dependent methyltransferase